jgi:hypothetical protein
METPEVQTCRNCGRYWFSGGSLGRTRIHQCVTCGTVSVMNPAERAQANLGAFLVAGGAPPIPAEQFVQKKEIRKFPFGIALLVPKQA